MAKSRQSIIKTLRSLEKDWTNDGLMIMAIGHSHYLCTKHPEDVGKVLESFDITNDGGDPDWNEDEDDER